MNASRESTGCLLPPPTPVGEEGSHCRRHDGAGRRHLADRLESHVRGVDRRSRAPRIGDGDSLSCVTGVCRRRGSPRVRATALGVYRFWRDLGYAVGALLSGLVADLLGMGTAIKVVAVLTFLSGLQVAIRMRETLNRNAIGVSRESASEIGS